MEDSSNEVGSPGLPELPEQTPSRKRKADEVADSQDEDDSEGEFPWTDEVIDPVDDE